MNLDELKQILEVVREHELMEFELEEEGFKLRIRKAGPGPVSQAPPEPAAAAPAAREPAGPHAADPPAAARGPLAPETADVELAIVKSPIVGTFYRAPEPGARPFAEVGAVVRKGQVLCIIEAMKLMNEIESEYDGEIVQIYVENGQPVQYGERLFALKAR